ncbi:MAG: VWA domain-containing protein [Aquificaceae bacterium]|nr:VWA domain-containing protein [Aquificaceae bacterium]MDW8237023.1 vWA domain-containing protein [Aquificaceae bacterium]
MIERLANLLRGEYDLEVEISQEGWGAGYDPLSISLTEMWARGELKDVPNVAKVPTGVVINAPEVGKEEAKALAICRHQIELLLGTDLYLWRQGQREFFKFGYNPSSFVALFSALEYLRAIQKLSQSHPESHEILIKHLEQTLKNIKVIYPHHEFVASILQNKTHGTFLRKDIESSLENYLNSSPEEAFELIFENFLSPYLKKLDESMELSQVLLLQKQAKEELSSARSGRIMTDLLKRLPKELQQALETEKEISQELKLKILKSIKTAPEWMRDYLKQMTQIEILEEDVKFFAPFLPKMLETEIEHRGFLAFIIKSWQAQSAKGQRGGAKSASTYLETMRPIRHYVDSLRKKLLSIMPEDEELFGGRFYLGKRLDYHSLSFEIPIKRGKIYQKRVKPSPARMAFRLLLDISSSMKKEDKLKTALRASLLFCEVLESLKMNFAFDVFNEEVLSLKEFEDNYERVLSKILRLASLPSGATNLEKAVRYSHENLRTFCLKTSQRGLLVVFSDGEPTRGAKSEELKSIIQDLKAIMPIVAFGVGKGPVEFYFEKTGINLKTINELPLAFGRLIENQIRRLLVYQQ